MKGNRRSIILVSFCLFMFFSLNVISGQDNPTRQTQVAPRPIPRMGSRITSPEIQPDNKVIFRLYAPKSVSVALNGEWMSGAVTREYLVRNDTGLWSTTLGPLPPEFYGYTFLVDGVNILDPSNPQIK